MPWTSAPAWAGCAGALVDADALLVTSLTNIRYLTGFTGSAGLLFVLPGEVVLITDGRYGLQAAEQLAGGEGHRRGPGSSGPGPGRAGPRDRGPPRRCRPSAWRPPTSAGRDSSPWRPDWFPGVELVSTVGLVEGLRRVKDAGELARLADAARIADEALDHVRPQLARACTEEAFAGALDFEMRRLGASGPSFETIVASGPNAAMPHHRPGSRRDPAGGAGGASTSAPASTGTAPT